jgi:hypothetical protein
MSMPVAQSDAGDQGRVASVRQQMHPTVKAQMLRGDTQIEQGRTATDQQRTSGRVGARQLSAGVGVDHDVPHVYEERPGLGVVQGRRRRRCPHQEVLVLGGQLGAPSKGVHHLDPFPDSSWWTTW